jgi:NADPH:quinone reductase-like Zn-dependent oxidoreductase
MEVYKRIVTDKPGDLEAVRTQELSFPELAEEEVFVHLEYSTVNPSDLGTALGRYPPTDLPVPIGLEGSGTVVRAGSGPYAQSLLNKRVAVNGRGTWGDYIKVTSDDVFPLLDSTSFEDAANLIVNPMTVALFIEIIQRDNIKVVIQNAAASALGKMLVKWGKQAGVAVVNLVRKQEQVEALQAVGADYVVNTSLNDWKDQARNVLNQLGGALAGFEAIGGTATGDMLELVSNGGTVYAYGRLSNENNSVRQFDLMMLEKNLKGLWLMPWIKRKSREDRVQVGYFVQNLLQNVFKTEHLRVVNLSQARETLLKYPTESATNNKILLRTRFE